MSNGANADPWAWLGLLKWSLSYVDGTTDKSDMVPMTAEDKAFLEKVMKEGIIDENARMKFILSEFGKAMEYYKASSLGNNASGDAPISENALQDLLQELRDIVEQIDYARAFCSLKGVSFLIGCISESKAVPESIRVSCVGLLSTLSQNNPPVQQELLELGTIKTLSENFFAAEASQGMKAKIMQAISSMVRNHELSEAVFCSLEQSSTLIMTGLNAESSAQQLKTRTLFFLRALLTSDTITDDNIRPFYGAIGYIADNYLEETNATDLREITISLLVQLLEQSKGINTILKRKNMLAAQGVQRISSLRALTGEDREFAQMEVEQWESFMVLLARTTPVNEEEVKEQTISLTG